MPAKTRAEYRRRRDIERAAQVALTQEMIACALDVPLAEMRAPTRRRAPVAHARQVAMYLMHVAFGFSLSAVGRHFGRDRTTAAHACRQIEDRRDNQDFDLLLDRLEFAVRAFPVSGLPQ
ncbi:MAG TPA: helix-turn-helix domain-containing protein [Parvibaculum sp.]|jgi:chromosomal replication initiation ATPase DnaA